MKKEKSDAYCNLCLKKGVEYVCASVDHDRIHRPIGGFHLCASCFEKLGLRKYVVVSNDVENGERTIVVRRDSTT